MLHVSQASSFTVMQGKQSERKAKPMLKYNYSSLQPVGVACNVAQPLQATVVVVVAFPRAGWNLQRGASPRPLATFPQSKKGAVALRPTRPTGCSVEVSFGCQATISERQLNRLGGGKVIVRTSRISLSW